MGAGTNSGKGLREVIIGIVLLVVLALLAFPLLRNTVNAKLDRTCQGNLKEWGAIFAVYRAENGYYFPLPHGYETFGPASAMPGCTNIDDAFDFAPDARIIFPDYASDPVILACPDAGGVVSAITLGPLVVSPPRLDARTFGIAEGSCGAAGTITRPGAGYTYLGFHMAYANDEDPQISDAQARLVGLPATGPANVVAMLEQFKVDDETDLAKAQALRGKAYNRGDYMAQLGWPYVQHGGDLGRAMVGPFYDISATVSGTAAALLGINPDEEMARTAGVPVMWDTIRQDPSGNPVFNHRAPEGCNVLYMDGHVEFVEYPSVFPVSTTFATMKAVR
ncbi:MAG: hypothetical protein HUU46_16095 [Candidatus Hydrogenedentes bacterium]|nr:hypothetical protein [Candidatus Hydrogenedentota bacterium]